MPHQIAQLDCETVTVAIGGQPLHFWRPLNPENFILSTVEEEFGEDERLPYWAMLWPASIALADYVAHLPHLAGQSFLELGAGLALPSLAAARAGATVLATDWYTDALEFAQASAALNRVQIHCKFLDWRHPPSLPRFDRIACADLLYERRNHAPILAAIDQLLAPTGQALFSDPERHMSPAFFEMASQQGWTCSSHARAVDWEGHTFQVDCWVLRRQ